MSEHEIHSRMGDAQRAAGLINSLVGQRNAVFSLNEEKAPPHPQDGTPEAEEHYTEFYGNLDRRRNGMMTPYRANANELRGKEESLVAAAQSADAGSMAMPCFPLAVKSLLEFDGSGNCTTDADIATTVSAGAELRELKRRLLDTLKEKLVAGVADTDSPSVPALRRVFERWATYRTNFGPNGEHFADESREIMRRLLQVLQGKLRPVAELAESYGIRAEPLRAFCHGPTFGGTETERTEIRRVLSELEGAILRIARSADVPRATDLTSQTKEETPATNSNPVESSSSESAAFRALLGRFRAAYAEQHAEQQPRTLGAHIGKNDTAKRETGDGRPQLVREYFAHCGTRSFFGQARLRSEGDVFYDCYFNDAASAFFETFKRLAAEGGAVLLSLDWLRRLNVQGFPLASPGSLWMTLLFQYGSPEPADDGWLLRDLFAQSVLAIQRALEALKFAPSTAPNDVGSSSPRVPPLDTTPGATEQLKPQAESDTMDRHDLPDPATGLAPSRINARAVYDWALNVIPDVRTLGYREVFDAILARLETEEAKASGAEADQWTKLRKMLPPNAVAFANYLRETGVKRHSTKNRGASRSVRRADQV